MKTRIKSAILKVPLIILAHVDLIKEDDIILVIYSKYFAILKQFLLIILLMKI